MIGSGRIELLQNNDLRIRLANWQGVFAELLEIRTGILLHADQEYETVLAEVDGILVDIKASISTH